MMSRMKKLLRTTDKILTALALLGDITIEAYVKGSGFDRKRSFLEAVTGKNATLQREIDRFLKTGEIEKVIDKKGNACFKLTSPGIEKFERLFPLSKLSSKPWDGKWRIVSFDIEEKQKSVREYLRNKLVSLGFGKLQESVYISPLDVLADLKEYLKNEKLYGRVVVFEAREVFGQDPKVLAAYVWRLERLNDEYFKLLEKAESLREKCSAEDKRRLRDEYFQLLLRDPLLPGEFLPDHWLGETARRFFLSW